MDKSEIEIRESYFCVIESEIKDYKEGDILYGGMVIDDMFLANRHLKIYAKEDYIYKFCYFDEDYNHIGDVYFGIFRKATKNTATKLEMLTVW